MTACSQLPCSMTSREPPPSAEDPAVIEALRHVHLLEGLPGELIHDIARACRFKCYRARQEVIARDDVDRDCFFILRGRLRVTAWSPSGREVSFRELEAGQVFGELAAIDGLPRSASVTADSQTLLARLSPETLEDLMQRHWPISQRMLQHLAGSARQLTERLYALSALSVQQRLAAELLRLGGARTRQAGPLRLDPAPTQRELAGRIDSVREQVQRELAELERLGLIRRREGAIDVPDVARLMSLVPDAA
jgi:CRP/FNR family transcriptional regulator, cyclic AMP receptor protein